MDEGSKGTYIPTRLMATNVPGVLKLMFEQADFEMVELGTSIANIISAGEGESDLYLTFTFSWNFPHIQEGTSEAHEKWQQVQEMAKGGVLMTINEIRDNVKAESKA
jgi:hypothetical protein